MKGLGRQFVSIALAFAWAGFFVPALADDTCLDFKWDVSKERALFAGTPAAVTAGQDAKSAPSILPNRLYALRLLPQDHVSFAVSPAKKKGATAYGGLAALKIPVQGSYRIAVDLPVWIDVTSSAALVPARDFQGQRGCISPHKIVEFDLTASQPLMLQFSDAASSNLLFTVTPSPYRKL